MNNTDLRYEADLAVVSYIPISRGYIVTKVYAMLPVSLICSFLIATSVFSRRVWRYRRGNQNPYIEEDQTTQWPKEKVQRDKQRSTKHTHRTKDRVIRTQLKTGGVHRKLNIRGEQMGVKKNNTTQKTKYQRWTNGSKEK
jgi:hypothetical protein